MDAPDDGTQRLGLIADAVADGELIDWAALEAEADSDAERQVIARLRVIASISSAHGSSSGSSLELSVHDSILHPALARRTSDAEPESPGQPVNWGPLTILEKVGSGRFGDVYRAWDRRLDREVALKLLRHRSPRPDDVESTIIGEARLMARVRHPNVATIYGAEHLDGRTGLWMEFIRGRTLEAELKDRGPFSAAEVVEIGIELCRAIGAVHRAGLVHRDLKAANVMRDQERGLIVGDFGAGTDLTEQSEPAGRRELAGTPYYLAPELLEGRPATAQSDIYSLGVLLYRLLTREFPVRGGTLRQIRDAHRRGARWPLAEARRGLPGGLLRVVDAALAANPAQRFAGAEAMERALQAARAPSRRPLLLAGAPVAAVTALAAWAAWSAFATRHRGPDSPGLGDASRRTAAVTLREISPDPDLEGTGFSSPDGRWLSYMDRHSGDLMLYEIATGARRRITSNHSWTGASGMAEESRFSSDSRQLMYVWRDVDQQFSELRVIGIDGQTARVVRRYPRGIEFLPHEWSRDGRFVAGVLTATDGSRTLTLVFLGDGSERHLAALGRTAPDHVSVSRDSQFVTFDARLDQTEDRDVYIVPADGGAPRVLVDDPARDSSPMWSADGESVLFLSDRNGSTGLWSIPTVDGRASGSAVALQRDLGRVQTMGLADSGALFLARLTGQQDVFSARVDLTSGLVLTPPTRLAEFAGRTRAPDWSFEGRRAAFMRNDYDRAALLVKDVVTGETRESPLSIGFIQRVRWLPTGSILVKADIDDRLGLYEISADLSRSRMLMAGGRFNNFDVSPDGRTIIYVGVPNRALVRRDIQTGSEAVLHQLPRPLNIYGVAVSPDGNEIAFTASPDDVGGSGLARGSQGWTLYVGGVVPGAPLREVFATGPGDTMYATDWTPDGGAVMVTRTRPAAGSPDSGSDQSRLWLVDRASGHTRPLDLTANGLRELRLARDGESVVFVAGWPTWTAWVLENALGR